MIDRPTFAMDSAAHLRTPSSGQRRDGERSESGRVRAADERAMRVLLGENEADPLTFSPFVRAPKFDFHDLLQPREL